MIKNLLFLIILMSSSTCLSSQEYDKSFVIYLVRHAEKDLSSTNKSDQALTECGKQRAEKLSEFFSSVDIEAVYSSDYIRTRDTAAPLALAKNRKVEIYNPRQLEEIAGVLLQQKQNALVVGHSNSTPSLTGLLIGEKLDAYSESSYNLISQVVISESGAFHQVFHTSFQCPE